jgi:hypothetical protein
MVGSFPWSNEKLAEHLLRAAEASTSTMDMAHHLAKAAVERWLAFELAADLDRELPDGWVALVETGAVAGMGNIDLLIVPTAATVVGSRIRPRTDPWPTNAVAIELKAAHLGDGEAGYRDALLLDLTTKVNLARGKNRECERWLGFLVTTDGLWKGSANVTKTAQRSELMKAGQLPVAKGITRIGTPIAKSLEYRDWAGTVWFEVFEAAKPQTA